MQHEAVTLNQIISAATVKWNDVDANTKLILTDAVEDCIAAHHEGLLTGDDVAVESLLRAHFHAKITRQLKQSSDRIKRLGEGSQPLDLGDDYELPFTVCGKSAISASLGMPQVAGRTTTLGLSTSNDWILIDQEEYLNKEKVNRAYARSHPLNMSRSRLLAPFPNYRAYRKAQGEDEAAS